MIAERLSLRNSLYSFLSLLLEPSLAKKKITKIASTARRSSTGKAYIMLETAGVLTIGLTCTDTAAVRFVPT